MSRRWSAYRAPSRRADVRRGHQRRVVADGERLSRRGAAACRALRAVRALGTLAARRRVVGHRRSSCSCSTSPSGRVLWGDRVLEEVRAASPAGRVPGAAHRLASRRASAWRSRLDERAAVGARGRHGVMRCRTRGSCRIGGGRARRGVVDSVREVTRSSSSARGRCTAGVGRAAAKPARACACWSPPCSWCSSRQPGGAARSAGRRRAAGRAVRRREYSGDVDGCADRPRAPHCAPPAPGAPGRRRRPGPPDARKLGRRHGRTVRQPDAAPRADRLGTVAALQSVLELHGFPGGASTAATGAQRGAVRERFSAGGLPVDAVAGPGRCARCGSATIRRADRAAPAVGGRRWAT